MRILALSDREEKSLWEYYEPGRLAGIDLILAAGDLNRRYLEFIATVASCPVFYVPGNHDTAYRQDPPQGCQCIDNQLVVYEGIRILGLGGSMRYNGGEYQYSEREMALRIARRRMDLWRHKGMDILLTHSPAFGRNDGRDRAHTGFDCFNDLVTVYQPACHIYGHVHPSYTPGRRALDRVGATRLVNAYGRVVVDLPCPAGSGELYLQKFY